MPAPRPKSVGLSLPLLAGGAIGLACLFGVAVFAVNQLFGGLFAAAPATETATTAIENTAVPTEAIVATEPATPTGEPTQPPTETSIPASPTPEGPYVVITGITIDSDNYYVVDYEVHNFPSSPQLHVHMFFDTVPPEQAGVPGSGPWKLTYGQYGDPPFRQYTVGNRPPNATQMCSLVANPNHSIQPGTGNCVALPQ
jgi:hypothetical protein